jgi:hypothetical protein
LATGLVLAMCGLLSGCGSCRNSTETAATTETSTSPPASNAPAPSSSNSLEQLVGGVVWPVIETEGEPVTVTLDHSRAAKATIGRRGGAVTATGADGTKYVLTIPANAITFPTQVIVTPIQQFGTFEVAGARRFAVDFAPHGLLLFRSATLGVQPADGNLKGGAFAISYKAEGVAPSATPVPPSSNSLTVPVQHFSGVAIYLGEGVSIPVPPAPKASWSEVESRIADLSRQARDEAIDNSEFVENTTAILDGYFNSTMMPNLPRMYADCSYAQQHLGEYLSFFKYAELVGGGEARYAEKLSSNGVIKGVLENCWKQRSKDCVRYDPYQIRELVGLIRQLQISGVAEPTDTEFKPCGNVGGQVEWTGEYSSRRLAYSSVDRHRAVIYVTGQWDERRGYEDRGSQYQFTQRAEWSDPAVVGGCSGVSRGTSSGTVQMGLQINGAEATLDGFVGATSVASRRCPNPVIEAQTDYGSFVTCPSTEDQVIKGKVNDGTIRFECSGEDSEQYSDGRGKETHKYVSKGFVTVNGYEIDFLNAMVHSGDPEPGPQ